MSTTNLTILFFAAIFIALTLFAYIRNRLGDQRMIQTTNNMLLPLLTIITITLGSIFSFHSENPICNRGIPNVVKYIAVLGTILFVVVGIIRYVVHRNRERLLIMQPLLLAIILVIIAFLLEHLVGCLY